MINPEELAYKPKKRLLRITIRRPRFQKRYIIIGILILALGAGAYFGRDYYLPKPPPGETPEQIAQREYEVARKKTDEMIAIVDEQIKLPTNEEPILATVSDRSELDSQDFFTDAQNGDKILMYPNNKKAYLYRPSTKKVLATAPLDYQVGKKASQSAVPSATISASEEL